MSYDHSVMSRGDHRTLLPIPSIVGVLMTTPSGRGRARAVRGGLILVLLLIMTGLVRAAPSSAVGEPTSQAGTPVVVVAREGHLPTAQLQVTAAGGRLTR